MNTCSNCIRSAVLRPGVMNRGALRTLTHSNYKHTFQSSFQGLQRAFHAGPNVLEAESPRPRPRDDRPKSDETTQTDFGELDVLGGVPPPASSIESCMYNGFVLSNGVNVQDAGMLLVGGEVFRWKPWNRDGVSDKSAKAIENAKASLVRLSGQLHIEKESWGILDLIWPKPDLLVIGTGDKIRPLSKETRQAISKLGIRVEVLDTRNAASQYNLLATERGVFEIAAAIIPIGFDYGK